MKRRPNRYEPVDLSDTPFGNAVETLMIALVVTAGAAFIAAAFLHWKNWRGTFALIPALAGLAIVPLDPRAAVVVAASIMAGVLRECWRYGDIKKGHQKLRRGKEAIGLLAFLRNWRDRRLFADGVLVDGDSYAAGKDSAGAIVRLPLGLGHGRHTLILGATGAGKTTSMFAAALAYLQARCGVVVIDAKGDPQIAQKLRAFARAFRRPFYSFSLDGNSHQWNPLAYGTPSERADKLIAAEQWTEPHYKRLYQRYLLALFVAADARGDVVDLAKVVQLLQPERLALYAREINDPRIDQIDGFLAALSDQEKRDLGGLRNRLALMVESEHSNLLSPSGDPANHIDLLTAIHCGAVVVFSLNTSRYPETAKLLGAALFQDLQSVAGVLESHPALQRPAAILVDEFGAFGQDHIVGLFQRARSVRLSLMLATQELADLRRIDPAFQDQVLGNVEAIVAHRQNVPESAELVAELGGTREVWIHTFQTDQAMPNAPEVTPSGRGTKRRGHEFYVAPDTIKQLDVGHAVVITKNPHRVRPTAMFGPRPVVPPADVSGPGVEDRLRALALDKTSAATEGLAGRTRLAGS